MLCKEIVFNITGKIDYLFALYKTKKKEKLNFLMSRNLDSIEQML